MRLLVLTLLATFLLACSTRVDSEQVVLWADNGPSNIVRDINDQQTDRLSAFFNSVFQGQGWKDGYQTLLTENDQYGLRFDLLSADEWSSIDFQDVIEGFASIERALAASAKAAQPVFSGLGFVCSDCANGATVGTRMVEIAEADQIISNAGLQFNFDPAKGAQEKLHSIMFMAYSSEVFDRGSTTLFEFSELFLGCDANCDRFSNNVFWSAAALIVRHSVENPSTGSMYRKALTKLQTETGLRMGDQYYLDDYEGMISGGPQVLGTYMDCVSGQAEFVPPLTSEDRSNQIRASLGLPSSQERLEQFAKNNC